MVLVEKGFRAHVGGDGDGGERLRVARRKQGSLEARGAGRGGDELGILRRGPLYVGSAGNSSKLQKVPSKQMPTYHFGEVGFPVWQRSRSIVRHRAVEDGNAAWQTCRCDEPRECECDSRENCCSQPDDCRLPIALTQGLIRNPTTCTALRQSRGAANDRKMCDFTPMLQLIRVTPAREVLHRRTACQDGR